MTEPRGMQVPDQTARQRALQTSESFIVQAPAGSGKTELLTQRYLALLARVDEPEEVIAVTFTRKAQGEMLDRIIAALQEAQDETPVHEPHRRVTREMATAVLSRDRARGWHIVDHPARLRIMTLDALNSALTLRMPYLSRAGGALAISQDPGALYRQAARRATLSLGDGGGAAAALEKLLAHLDNHVDRMENLLAAMLSQRDRWLRLVVPKGAEREARASLERGMQRLVEDTLAGLAAMFSEAQCRELTEIAHFAAQNVAEPSSFIQHCHGITRLPQAHAAELDRWRGLAELLLTKRGAWRKKLDKRQGFPEGANNEKRRIEALVRELEKNETVRAQLNSVAKLPTPRYTENQWSILQALLEVLPLAAAHLDLIFNERGEVDYTAVASRALQALGDLDEPSDLALQLDYSIRHVLVDEFQDTSYSQYELLERLTAGWQAGDGRTLFCVGDPMQSIYRFREADVGLFLQARRQGLSNVKLQTLQLSVNFRSQQGIVDWVNAMFPTLFPATEDITSGAVPYTACHAHHSVLPGKAVTCHPRLHDDIPGEARDVVTCVRAARKARPDGTVGVLVSARPHLAAILPELKRAGIEFQAIEIERLLNRPMIQDLVALTRATTHLADRTAWLAVLRAPWCGMSLGDLYALCAGDGDRTTWDQMNDHERITQMTEDGQARLARIVPILSASLKERGRRSLRRRVEGTWLALGGPATLEFPTDLGDAMAYLELVDELEKGGELLEPADLQLRLTDLYAVPEIIAPDAVQVMTIHKAKGLQFDTVILPGLGRRPRPSEKSLLHWMETARAPRRDNVVLASIQATGDESDPWHDYLFRLEQEREALERGRLLYVAVTRARRRLHLLGHTTLDTSCDPPAIKKPAKGTPLELLWPAVQPEFHRALSSAPPPADEAAPESARKGRGIHRLPHQWQLPAPHDALEVKSTPADSLSIASIEFDWAGEAARQVGIIVHRELRRIASDGLAVWSAERVQEKRGVYAAHLEESGLPASERPGALDRVHRAIANALEDSTGRWILGQQTEAENELALSGVHQGGKIVNIVVDRTFVDERGRRWVIDYKTSAHTGGGQEAFLDTEVERYRPQLALYGSLLSRRHNCPVHLALYFPLFKAWRELGVIDGQ